MVEAVVKPVVEKPLRPEPICDPSDGELRVSWEHYHRLIEHLALQLQHSGHSFDQVVALSRGGLRVGDTLSRLFKRPLVIMAARSYGGGKGRAQEELRLGNQLAHTCEALGPKLLLVDDLVDSGDTLHASRHWLQETLQPELIKTAVLWLKTSSRIKPDFWAMELPGNPWVVQPFERWEHLHPSQLQPLPEGSGDAK